MLGDISTSRCLKEYKLYKRRWGFLIALSALQMIYAFSYACFGQVSNIFVAFYRISYTEIDWLTLALDIGPIVLTIPFSWITNMKWFGFRNLVLTAAFCFTIGFVCLTSSVASRSLCPLMLVGQIINSVAVTALMTSPSTLAVLWFPENQVGTAIALMLMNYNLGSIIGFTLPSNVLSSPSSNNTTTSNQTWIVEDQHKLTAIFSSFLFIAIVGFVFLFIYVTDHPPTPPTRSQEIRQRINEDVGVLSLKSYTQLVKSLLTNRAYVLACFIFGTLYHANTVQYTMLSQILKQMFAKENDRLNADALGGYIMVTYSVGCMLGAIFAGFLVNRYKRYNILTAVSCILTFSSTFGMVIAFLIDSLPMFFISSPMFGISSQIGVVAIYEIITQETYPIDEKFSTIWMTGIQTTMGIFYGEIGRILFNSHGGLAVLIFQSVSVFLSLLFSCSLKIENKRLNVDEFADDVATNASECSPLMLKRS